MVSSFGLEKSKYQQLELVESVTEYIAMQGWQHKQRSSQ
jgi:hypothetical protein